MSTSKKDAITGFLIVAVYFGLPLVVVGVSLVQSWWEEVNPKTVCATESIPFDTTEVESADYNLGDRISGQPGVNGLKEICTRNDTTISNKIIAEPVNHIIYTGTKNRWSEYMLANPPASQGGAICADGTRSYSTGRGTCSWHGGVSQWLN